MRGEASWVQEVGFLSAAKLLLKLRGLLLLPIIIGLLGTEAFGVWVQWLAVVGLVSTLSGLGLKTSAIRLLTSAGTADDAGRWFWSIAAGAVLLSLGGAALLGALAAPIAVYLLQYPDAAGVFLLGMFYLPPRAMADLQIRLFRGVGRIRTSSILEVVDAAGQTALIIAALLVRETLFAAVVALLVWQVIFAVALLPLTLTVAPLRRPAWKRLRAALAFGVPTVPASAASAVIDKADRFLIGYFLGAGAVGVYGAAYTLGALILQILEPVRQTLVPRLGRLWDTEGKEPVIERLGMVWRLFALLAVPAAVGIGMVGGDLLLVLGNPEIARDGAGLVFWLAVSQILYGATTIGDQIFLASRNTRSLPVVYGTGAVANTILNLLLIPIYGLSGAVVATFVSYFISAAVSILLARRIAFVRFDMTSLWKASVAAAAMGGVVWTVGGSGVARVVLVVPLGAGVYALVLLLLGAVTRAEIQAVRRKLARRK